MSLNGLLGRVGVEAGWWVAGTARLVRRHPGRALVLLALVWWAPAQLVAEAAVLVIALVGVGRVWSARWPLSWAAASGRARGWVWRLRVRRRWRHVALRCGLADDRTWHRSTGHPRGRVPRPLVPPIRGRASVWPHVSATVWPLTGQTVESFVKAGEAVRIGYRASRLRVEPAGDYTVRLTFTIGDELRTPFPSPIGRADPALGWVTVGRREDGQPWRLALGPHTLVAGCSGAGKGSVFWSFAFALAPAVTVGRVQLHGIDLKGGMETAMGAGLFASTATTPVEAVTLLEDLVTAMRERTHGYACRTRVHTHTMGEPLVVVMIDELAALTAYVGDRDLHRRAERAVNLLCSQGRAPGFMVFACLQDPRKEVIPSRGLFTQMVGLRLKDLSETAMVLGEAALGSGALCHRITRTTPGVGYVQPEDGTPPVRVRAGYATDDAIRSVAGTYPAPGQRPVVVPDPAPGATPRPGRPRPARRDQPARQAS